jgi:hypothetical protein
MKQTAAIKISPTMATATVTATSYYCLPMVSAVNSTRTAKLLEQNK